MGTTPIYNIPYPDAGTKMNALATKLEQLAAGVDAALVAAEIPPAPPAAIVVSPSQLARDTHWGIPASAAARLALQNAGATTIRTDLGYTEQYFAALTDGGSNPGGRTVAGWERVGPLDTGWVALALTSGWVNYGSGLGTARYRRIGNRVQVAGLIKNGTIAPGTIIATLPVGSRPSSGELYAAHDGASGAVGMQVSTNGQIACATVGSNAELSLANITFLVD